MNIASKSRCGPTSFSSTSSRGCTLPYPSIDSELLSGLARNLTWAATSLLALVSILQNWTEHLNLQNVCRFLVQYVFGGEHFALYYHSVDCSQKIEGVCPRCKLPLTFVITNDPDFPLYASLDWRDIKKD